MSGHVMLCHVMLFLTSSLLKAMSSTDELPTKFIVHINSTVNLKSVPSHRLRQQRSSRVDSVNKCDRIVVIKIALHGD
jgi:hypothetical protein